MVPETLGELLHAGMYLCDPRAIVAILQGKSTGKATSADSDVEGVGDEGDREDNGRR